MKQRMSQFFMQFSTFFHNLRQKRHARQWLILLFWLYLFWCECIVRSDTGKQFWTSSLFLVALFTLVGALALYSLCSLFPRRANRVVERILVIAVAVFYMSQLIYFYKFHCYYSAYSMGNGGQIIEFWQIILKALYVKFLPLVLLLLPMVALLLFGCIFSDNHMKWTLRLTAPLLALALHFGIVALLPLFGTSSSVAPYRLYHSTNDLQQASYRLGLLPAFRLDVHRALFGFEGGALEEPDIPEEITEATQPTETDTDVEYNVLNIDFDALAAKEENETVRQLHEYFAQQTPTEKNDKTGIFAGCNLIQITAESFSYLAIDPELTPTLYKLQTGGFQFTDFYTAYWGVSTSDGEYVALTGTIPKSGTWSMNDTQYNYMPLTIASQLKALGYETWAFHNHDGTYYHRDKSHPNLGYTFLARGMGLEVTDQWPESDVEMIDLSTEYYVNHEPFHAYYMTVSGHLEYDWESNAIAAKHRDEVKDLPYSEEVKAYLACQIELDQALELLLERLEEAGVLENTVIVLTADHYPYGLTLEQQSELAGHDIEERFELYRNACIIYKEGMTPETVDWPCSSLDLLPTLSNLFGIDFDSRLYMGHDMFSGAQPLIIFSDRSWWTDIGAFDSLSLAVTSFRDITITDEIANYYHQIIADKFLVSQWILEEDYWGILFDEPEPPKWKDSITIN